MKYHILFSGKNKKNISKCCLLKILPRVLRVNTYKYGICTWMDDLCVVIFFYIFFSTFSENQESGILMTICRSLGTQATCLV